MLRSGRDPPAQSAEPTRIPTEKEWIEEAREPGGLRLTAGDADLPERTTCESVSIASPEPAETCDESLQAPETLASHDD